MQTLGELSLALGSHTVAQATEWLDHIAHAQQWPSRTQFKLRLCLDETLTNTVMHGFTHTEHSATPCIELSLRQEDDQLTLTVRDNGIPFDPTAQASRDLDTSLETAQIGGHGLRLMRHYLSDLRYQRRDGWNQLELVTQIDPA